jgi:calcineurin-like phosphoesterase family protein
MDEVMVNNWNSVVKPSDKVYHLGDVAIHAKALPILSRLNGHKRLVRGNHDIYDTSEYLKYFEEIHGVRVFREEGAKFVCSHVPLHPDSVDRWEFNVHGHLHANLVMKSLHHPDPRYINVSVEQINYTPVSMDQIRDIIKARV